MAPRSRNMNRVHVLLFGPLTFDLSQEVGNGQTHRFGVAQARYGPIKVSLSRPDEDIPVLSGILPTASQAVHYAASRAAAG